jgi:hypothetical protein
VEPERPATPLWIYGLVALAAVLACLWVVRVVVGVLLGFVKVAIVVILAVAIVGWVLDQKTER